VGRAMSGAAAVLSCCHVGSCTLRGIVVVQLSLCSVRPASLRSPFSVQSELRSLHLPSSLVDRSSALRCSPLRPASLIRRAHGWSGDVLGSAASLTPATTCTRLLLLVCCTPSLQGVMGHWVQWLPPPDTRRAPAAVFTSCKPLFNWTAAWPSGAGPGRPCWPRSLPSGRLSAGSLQRTMTSSLLAGTTPV
jgi:hypothetical protein